MNSLIRPKLATKTQFHKPSWIDILFLTMESSKVVFLIPSSEWCSMHQLTPLTASLVTIFLFSGPPLQTNIIDVLIYWRSHKYFYSTDIQKMYRQINVHESHRRFQRILWRFSDDDPLMIFNLNTVTYGLAPSAYQALRCLRQFSVDEGETYPLVWRFTEKNMILFLVNFLKIGIQLRKSNAFEFLVGFIFRPTFALNFMGLEMKKPLPLSFTCV